MIEIGAVYQVGDTSLEAWIGGPCKEHPEWVWSTQGNWYRQDDGRYITCSPLYKRGELIGVHHFPMALSSWRDLGDKIRDSWKGS